MELWGSGKGWHWSALSSGVPEVPHSPTASPGSPLHLLGSAVPLPCALQLDRTMGGDTTELGWPGHANGPGSQRYPVGETASLSGKCLRLFASRFSSALAISWYMLGHSVSPLRGAVSPGRWGPRSSSGAVAHVADQGTGDAAAPGCVWGPWRGTCFLQPAATGERVLAVPGETSACPSPQQRHGGSTLQVLPTALTPTAPSLGVAPASPLRSQRRGWLQGWVRAEALEAGSALQLRQFMPRARR